jgi:hypothetical protein
MKQFPGAMRAARMIGALALGASIATAQPPAGTLRTWGHNDNGQLGDGRLATRPFPNRHRI